MKDARQTAFEILLKIQEDNAYSNIALDTALDAVKLTDLDTSLVSALVYGTLERIITIDYNLSLYLKRPINRLQPEVLTVLRLGVCQILFMDKIPVSAAVNESVKIIKITRSAFASGLVNAVLHKITDMGLKLPSREDNELEYLSVKYSCPLWLVSLWIESYGLENALGIMEFSFIKPPATVRVNTTKTTTGDLICLLNKEGVSSKLCEEADDALTLENAGAVKNISAFNEGLFHFQDVSSQLCCKALNAKPEDVVFDLCSAPGGKAFTLAEIMKGKGRVYAYDIYESRLELIRQGSRRLELKNIFVNYGDASVYNKSFGFADKVICDVPCSGLGTIRRKPEIRYKKAENIDKLPELQYFILCNASKYVKLGGTLAYSTCTLNPKENEEVCEKFLEHYPAFCAINVPNETNKRSAENKFWTMLPHLNNSDGFFIALFSKTE